MLGFGCDEATIVVQIGSEVPLATFSQNQSRIIYAQQNSVYSINLKQIQHQTKDGEIIIIPPKQLGSSDIFPNRINYSPNGRYFAILSDREFIISTSGVYRSSCVGNCYDLSWCEGDSFVTKEGSGVKIYSDLKEAKAFKPGFPFDSVYGGPYITVKNEDNIFIYDIDNSIFIRKIEVSPNKVVWNDKKTKVALICEDMTYILNVNTEAIDSYIEEAIEGNANAKAADEGCEDSFEPNYEINEKVVNGFFIDDVFVFQNAKHKINYSINDRIFSITTLSSKFY